MAKAFVQQLDDGRIVLHAHGDLLQHLVIVMHEVHALGKAGGNDIAAGSIIA